MSETTRRRRSFSTWIATAAAAAAVGAAVAAPAANADTICPQVGGFCGFYSPSHRIDCEIDTGGRTGPDSVYCKTLEPARSASMDDRGTVTTCSGPSCVGDAAEGTPTLAYGQTVVLGPFRCSSARTGVTCTAAQGRGFTISTGGIANVG
ncbi:hypothetical protein H7K45_07035 [Mycobacterium yunnanensis]|uniref:Secreted protein n=1 Tax=Mycobacterium yunnanensis TaxID=368477 RepID=A0A9X3BS74_9MYCO|nr:hypothetical protein [Mycobacterium yunnanensis]MCV7420289.1 hypothetical protein [Mycobacterium yunnanensis]